MPPDKRSGPHHEAAPATPTARIVTRPGDGFRAQRLRKFARLQLDEMLMAPDPWVFSEPVGDPYLDNGLSLTWHEREAAGRELASAGWTP